MTFWEHRSSAWLPYLELPEIPLLPGVDSAPTLKPFGTLWVLGVALGAWLSLRQGRRQGLDREALVSLMFWMMSSAFVAGHLLDVLLYTPQQLTDFAYLVDITASQSSFGGFVGALMGTLVWRARHRLAVLPYCDAIGSSFPAGFGIGRLGCAAVHDHPGRFSDSFWAVAFPEGRRFDLGLLEALFLLSLAAVFYFVRRRWFHQPGMILGVLCTTYAPVRFALDSLRAEVTGGGDVRYAALTPAQWLCVPLGATGLILLGRALRGGRSVRPR